MSALTFDRRTALLAGAAAFAAAPLSSARAARDTRPGGFSRAGLAKIPPAMQHAVDAGAAVGIVTLLYRHGEIAQVTTSRSSAFPRCRSQSLSPRL